MNIYLLWEQFSYLFDRSPKLKLTLWYIAKGWMPGPRGVLGTVSQSHRGLHGDSPGGKIPVALNLAAINHRPQLAQDKPCIHVTRNFWSSSRWDTGQGTQLSGQSSDQRRASSTLHSLSITDWQKSRSREPRQEGCVQNATELFGSSNPFPALHHISPFVHTVMSTSQSKIFKHVLLSYSLLWLSG